MEETNLVPTCQTFAPLWCSRQTQRAETATFRSNINQVQISRESYTRYRQNTFHPPCRHHIRDCPHDITLVCRTLSRHDIVLGEQRGSTVTDRACEIAPVGPNCWMHDHSIRPKRRRRASNNTQTPPRKCQELNHQV